MSRPPARPVGRRPLQHHLGGGQLARQDGGGAAGQPELAGEPGAGELSAAGAHGAQQPDQVVEPQFGAGRGARTPPIVAALIRG